MKEFRNPKPLNPQLVAFQDKITHKQAKWKKKLGKSIMIEKLQTLLICVYFVLKSEQIKHLKPQGFQIVSHM